MRAFMVLALITLHLGVCVLAQTPLAQSFEVSSVKPRPPADTHPIRPDYCQRSGRFTMLGTPIDWSIRYAYQMRDYQLVGGPDWVRDFHTAYNIEATAGRPVSTEECRAMVRSLLVDRFKLKTHREQRESNVYFLTIGKNGPTLREGGEVWFNGLQFDASGKPTWPDGITMSQLASMLSSRTDRPVVDRTGLQGKYGMRLDFSLADGDDRPSVFTAVQEQLGLKLDPGRAPIDVLVIDHIEKPTPNE
jgi:uncharacterized protein (TIGR03435 family)